MDDPIQTSAKGAGKGKETAMPNGGLRPQDIVSRWMNEALAINEGDTWLNRRRRTRYDWSPTLDVYSISNEDSALPIIAMGRNISEMGMGFRSRIKIPLHSCVLICRGGTSEGVRARVASCTQTVGGYVIGVQFDFGTMALPDSITRKEELPASQ